MPTILVLNADSFLDNNPPNVCELYGIELRLREGELSKTHNWYKELD